MNTSNPAIVAQDAVRRLPRWILLFLCVAYALPGFVLRSPWKADDMSATGYMFSLAQGQSSWLSPSMAGLQPEPFSLLPYWIGALAMKLAPAGVPLDLAARMPFMALLLLAFAATWYGVYYLARREEAQPVAFAFGGEAKGKAYARAIADGALLAMIATLGLVQIGHEATSTLVQLFAVSSYFYALSAYAWRPQSAAACAVLSLLALTLSAAPLLAVLLALSAAVFVWTDHFAASTSSAARKRRWTALFLTLACVCLALPFLLDLWYFSFFFPDTLHAWRSLGRLLLWFAWPTWLLALLCVWRWRRQLWQRKRPRHLMLPLALFSLVLLCTIFSHSRDRVMLLSLPALAALASFSLPTLNRNVRALIDWFTLLFFTACAIVLWVMWCSVIFGIPAKPAANIAKLAPEFIFTHSWPALAWAVLVTLAWAWVVGWRIGRNPPALWKSLVLPAAGVVLCWQLLMSIWLPLVDYARSYAPQVSTLLQNMHASEDYAKASDCVLYFGLGQSQVAALTYHGRLAMHALSSTPTSFCPWLMVDEHTLGDLQQATNIKAWHFLARAQRSANRDEHILLFQSARF